MAGSLLSCNLLSKAVALYITAQFWYSSHIMAADSLLKINDKCLKDESVISDVLCLSSNQPSIFQSFVVFSFPGCRVFTNFSMS